MLRSYILLYAATVFYPTHASAQVCSCAGTPLLGSLDDAATPRGDIVFGSTVRHQSIGDLISAGSQITGADRSRTSQSIQLEARVGITRSLSATISAPIVRHRRTVDGVNGTDALTTISQGDLLTFLRFTPLRLSAFMPYELSFGTGLKAPTGASHITSNDILVAEDMQPGTGSWDAVFWSYGARALTRSANARVYLSTTYRRNGTNSRHFRHGNEWQVSTGVLHHFSERVGYSVTTRYRNASRSTRNGSDLTNTGGTWIDLVPGIGVDLTRKLTLIGSTEIPIYRSIKGTQFTTSYAMSFAIYYAM
jgi:hypothetical protein